MRVSLIEQKQLVTCLVESFQEWPITLHEPQRKDIAARCSHALSMIDDTHDFERILEHTVDAAQLDWAIDRARLRYQSSLIDRQCGIKWIDRWKHLHGLQPVHGIEISVSISIHAITLPDPAKDEMAVDVRLYSGCKLDQLLDFMIYHKLIEDKSAANEVRERWLNTKIQNPDDQKLIEQVLDVSIDKVSSEHRRRISYSIGDVSGFVWRFCDMLCILPVQLDLSSYPFDKTQVSLLIKCGSNGYLKRLVPDKIEALTKSINLNHLIPPRGFTVANCSEHLKELTFSEAADTHLDHRLLFRFELHRITSTFKWRILFPTIMILCLCFVATVAAYLKFVRIDANAVLTSVLPSVLIACVAMQLTSAQTTPAQSGRTRIDTMFVWVYLIILAHFLFLSFFPWPPIIRK